MAFLKSRFPGASGKRVWHGWVGVFMGISLLLVLGSVAILGISGGNDVAAMKIWITISAVLYLILMILMAVFAVKYQRQAVREYMMAEREINENVELMQAICANYNAVYYCDYLKNEIRFIQIGNRIISNMPKEYDESHPLDWYVKTYCEKIVADDYKEAFMKNVGPDNIREKLKDRDYFTYVYVGDKNGVPTYFQMKAAKVNGSENYFIVGFEDVNEQVRESEISGEMLREALSQAERSNRAKADFLSRMTKDFMTPLNSIVISAKTLEIEGAPAIEKETRKLLSAAGNLDNMITETLDAGYINDGKMFIETRPFDVSKTFAKFVATASERAKNGDINFVTSCQMVHEIIIGDSEKLASLLKHIAYFAIENVEANSDISVNMLETQVLNRKAYFDIFFEIPDVIISETDIEKILNDDNCSFAEYIGLSIAVILTRMMGGKMEIDSNTVTGTCIKLHLAFNYER